MRRLILLGFVAALPFQAASAAETIAYSYDAKGRLVRTAHSGSVNSGVVATYAFDKADNRTSLTVSGSAFNSAAMRETSPSSVKKLSSPAANS